MRPGLDDGPPPACPVCGAARSGDEPALCRAGGEPVLRGGWAPMGQDRAVWGTNGLPWKESLGDNACELFRLEPSAGGVQ